MARLNKIATNFAQGLTAAEKQQARDNIGMQRYKPTVENIFDAETKDLTSGPTGSVAWLNTQFKNGYEYHLMIALPSSIELSDYAKPYARVYLFFGSLHHTTATWKMGMNVPVTNSVAKFSTTIIPFDWFGENLPDEALLNHPQMAFADIDDPDNTTIHMASGQTFGISLRGKCSKGSYESY